MSATAAAMPDGEPRAIERDADLAVDRHTLCGRVVLLVDGRRYVRLRDLPMIGALAREGILDCLHDDLADDPDVLVDIAEADLPAAARGSAGLWGELDAIEVHARGALARAITELAALPIEPIDEDDVGVVEVAVAVAPAPQPPPPAPKPAPWSWSLDPSSSADAEVPRLVRSDGVIHAIRSHLERVIPTSTLHRLLSGDRAMITHEDVEVVQAVIDDAPHMSGRTSLVDLGALANAIVARHAESHAKAEHQPQINRVAKAWDSHLAAIAKVLGVRTNGIARWFDRSPAFAHPAPAPAPDLEQTFAHPAEHPAPTIPTKADWTPPPADPLSKIATALGELVAARDPRVEILVAQVATLTQQLREVVAHNHRLANALQAQSLRIGQLESLLRGAASSVLDHLDGGSPTQPREEAH